MRLPNKKINFALACTSLLLLFLISRPLYDLYITRPPNINQDEVTKRIKSMASQDVLKIAVIGDFGFVNPHEKEVADLVKSWNPTGVITVGDNSYGPADLNKFDQSVGQYYQEYIYPYKGNYGIGSPANRFYPALGNHDWKEARNAYFDYFTLPGNERYYDFTIGDIHFFSLNSNDDEPDGVTVDSVQAKWLQTGLQSSKKPYKIVYFHHAPYTSGAEHEPAMSLRWPFKKWGATAVITGHIHNYERVMVDNFPYFVNGLGGHPGKYTFKETVKGSVVRYRDNFGAMLITADSKRIEFIFVDVTEKIIDQYAVNTPGVYMSFF